MAVVDPGGDPVPPKKFYSLCLGPFLTFPENFQFQICLILLTDKQTDCNSCTLYFIPHSIPLSNNNAATRLHCLCT